MDKKIRALRLDVYNEILFERLFIKELLTSSSRHANVGEVREHEIDKRRMKITKPHKTHHKRLHFYKQLLTVVIFFFFTFQISIMHFFSVISCVSVQSRLLI